MKESRKLLKMPTQDKYIKKETYPINKVLPYVLFVSRQVGKKMKVMFDGDLMDMSSERYQVFKLKGVKCSVCGIEGKYFTKEKSKYIDTNSYHFNLYAWDDEKNEEVLMTKDHIVPASLGGINHLANLQVMCSRCNLKKLDKLPEDDVVERVIKECQIPVRKYIKNLTEDTYLMYN